MSRRRTQGGRDGRDGHESILVSLVACHCLCVSLVACLACHMSVSQEPSQEVRGACPRARRLHGLRELLLVLESQEQEGETPLLCCKNNGDMP
jgi:hypothetical protein